MAKTIRYRQKIESAHGVFIVTGYFNGHESYIVRRAGVSSIGADVYEKASHLESGFPDPIRTHDFSF